MRATSEQRHQPFERCSMKPDAYRAFERPAQPRSGEREGRGHGMRDPFVRRKLRGKASARAVPERIARRQHGGRPAPARQHARRIERHWP